MAIRAGSMVIRAGLVFEHGHQSRDAKLMTAHGPISVCPAEELICASTRVTSCDLGQHTTLGQLHVTWGSFM